MQLSREEISKNYFETLKLASKLVNQTRREKGYSAALSPAMVTELAQTAAGSETIVKLIQTELFSPIIYEPQLLDAIDQCKKQLFPDVKKRRFISLSQTGMEITSEDTLESDEIPVFQIENTASRIVHTLKSNLSTEDFNYINQVLQNKSINLSMLLRALNINSEYSYKPDFKFITQKISLLRKFYPSGIIFDSSNINVSKNLNQSIIINCYRNVYLGIDNTFPLFFLQRNAQKRALVLVRYLIEKILAIDPREVLENEDETFFIRHKLQNVYRLFNYSSNRALGNAYPEIIHPWLSSRTSDNFWEKEANRIQAIQWLVEEKLQISPKNIYAHSITRKDFADNGLSYMFNQYYNSVSKALNETYPQLNLWEIGPVSIQYWHDKNAIKAVNWLIQKNRWNISDLPKLVSEKKLNRKTFSQYGLATLFEKKFNKNIYQAINLAYPRKFEPWEFGKVSSSYWKDRKNVQRASCWFAEHEGIEEQKIPGAIRTGRLSIKSLKKYSFGNALKKICSGNLEQLFASSIWKEHAQFLDEKRIMNKIQSLIRKEKQHKNLRYYLLYGFFTPNMELVSNTYVEQYERMVKRIKRRRDFVSCN